MEHVHNCEYDHALAVFTKVLHIQRQQHGADRHTRKQVSEHRTEPEPARQRHGDDSRDEDQEGEDQEPGHCILALPLEHIRYAARARSSQARSHACFR